MRRVWDLWAPTIVSDCPQFAAKDAASQVHNKLGSCNSQQGMTDFSIRCYRCGRTVALTSAVGIRLRAVVDADWSEPIEGVFRRAGHRLKCEVCGAHSARLLRARGSVHEEVATPRIPVVRPAGKDSPVGLDSLQSLAGPEPLTVSPRRSGLWVGLAVAAYAGGCAVLNEAVRQACTHPNCEHGWYSQNTGPQQSLFWLWAVGFPALVMWRLNGRDK